MPYPPQKKEKNITLAKTNAPISLTSSKRLKVTIQTYRMGNKELKMKLGQLHEEISNTSLPVSADLNMTLNQLFWKLGIEHFHPS